jgi:serine/threonine-protein kinase RsbW
MSDEGVAHVAHKHPDVELRIPADSAFLAVLRTATAGLAARLDFTLDDIEDLRIAVDEACAMVLPQAREDSQLTCTFDLEEARLTVSVTAECDSPRPPNRDGFAWTVLAALTNEVSAEVAGDRLTVTLARGTSDAGAHATAGPE